MENWMLTETCFLRNSWISGISKFIFSKLVGGRNPPNPAIWLVPGASGILRSCPLTWRNRWFDKIVCCLWMSKNRHFPTIFLLKLALLLALPGAGEGPESLREGGGGAVGKKYLYGEATSRGPPYPSRKRSRFVIDSCLTTVHFQQLKGILTSKQGMWNGYH